MKIKGIIFLLLIIGAYIFNYYKLNINWLPFTGIVLGLLILLLFLLNFYYKFKNRNKTEKEKYSYAFPDSIAKAMKNVDQRTQYESGLLSMFFLLIGMIAFSIYFVTFTEFSWWYKAFYLFNSFWGAVFMISMLVTNYQAYVAYMAITEELAKSLPQNINTSNLLKDSKMKEEQFKDSNINTLKGGIN